MADWPKVLPDADGIKPTGDACFYCHRKVGDEHARDCTVILRAVRVRYTFEVPLQVPHSWSDAQVANHRRGSAAGGVWCAVNAINEIVAHSAERGCPCEIFTMSVVENQTPDMTPIQRQGRKTPMHVDAQPFGRASVPSRSDLN